MTAKKKSTVTMTMKIPASKVLEVEYAVEKIVRDPRPIRREVKLSDAALKAIVKRSGQVVKDLKAIERELDRLEAHYERDVLSDDDRWISDQISRLEKVLERSNLTVDCE